MTSTTFRKYDHRQFIPAIGLLLILFSSCSLTRTVEDNQFLLNKIDIKVNNRNLKSDLGTLVKQKENRKLLWIMKFKLRFYNSFIFKKDSDAKLRHSIGEPPVIYDSLASYSTVKQMTAYLKNKGYYENEVSFEAKNRRPKNKKMKVIYNVKLGKATTIADISLDVASYNLQTDLARDQKRTFLKIGDNFDIDVLEKERNRLTRLMQNEGYFFFTKDLIFYHADTLREKHKAFISLRLKENPQKVFEDSIPVNPYRTYRVGNIIVRQDFDKSVIDIQRMDTLNDYGYYFLDEKTFTVKPKVVSRSIFHRENDFYILENHENTYRRLSALNNYKYINISYAKSKNNLPNHLDCLISLSPSKPKSFSIETNGTNTGGILGINGTVGVSHRNAFRGAELLRFSIYGGLEAQSVKSGDDVVENTPFNTVEVGPELSLVLPKFLLPIDQNRYSKRVIPRTTATISYNYQRRPDYTRNVFNGGLIYSWKESKTKSHAIQPVNISEIQIFKSEDFNKRLDDLDNSSLKASYEDNFITSVMYSFVYNDQILDRKISYNIFRGNLELAGNTVYFLDKNVFKTVPDENGQYKINGIPYAHFIRSYVEFIHNQILSPKNHVVSRTFIGVGVPYGNSSAMPFVRSFYGGGTNGIRAWQARSLGPGSIPNDSLNAANVDQIGDIKGEQNIEYRFGIFKYLEGALFVDIGNIWYINNKDFGEAGNFKLDKLWKDLAIGTGVGIRLNFDYFVIRFDVAKRMKDPGADDPQAVKFFYSDPPIYNFAIGYPF